MNLNAQSFREVLIYQSGEYVESRNCRLVPLPGGAPGVLYRGLIYPLVADERLDLAGPAFVPDAIAPAAPTPAPVRHLLVAGEQAGYVLVVGDVADRERIAALIRGGGASVSRTGRYLGEPIGDELMPDWFVRFDLAGGDFARIEQALAEAFPHDDHPPQPTEVLRSRLLMAEIIALKAEQARLATENARLRLELAETVAAAGAVSAETSERVREEHTELVATLTASLAAEAKAREEAEVLAASLPANLPSPTMSASKSLTREVATIMRTAFPRVRLLRDGELTLTLEYRDRAGVYGALAQINPDKFPADAASWKKLQGLDGWWERHVSDGTSDAGRLYARRASEDRMIELLASTKREQLRDIAWLRRQ